jgi:hypothetical protein|tara:strand:- start:9435 stop:9638 length:204 start_codon:yes stop_codon:yes gene_type:complete
MAVEQLTSGNDDGSVMGASTSEKIAFFGGTPSAQVAIGALASAATIATAVLQIQLIQAELESKGLIG